METKNMWRRRELETAINNEDIKGAARGSKNRRACVGWHVLLEDLCSNGDERAKAEHLCYEQPSKATRLPHPDGYMVVVPYF